MRKPDLEVREVVCYETGKPMQKIPPWMAEIKVKFVSDEARQRHPAPPSLVDLEPVRRVTATDSDMESLKVLTDEGDEEEDADFDLDVEVEETEDASIGE